MTVWSTRTSRGCVRWIHGNGRRYVYANFAGTLNAPADLATNYMPPTRHAMHEMARQAT